MRAVNISLIIGKLIIPNPLSRQRERGRGERE
jgi:hypothetical protein